MIEFQSLTNKNWRRKLKTICLLFTISAPYSLIASEAQTIDFNRDIRQILSNNCFFCHGPDEEDRKGGLRLDTFEGATKLHKGRQAIVPGDPDKSELIARIITHDVDDVMPPHESGKEITSNQLQLLKTWIKEGANYAKHWAYVKPTSQQEPKVSQKSWIKNPIDSFILAKLEANQLSPSPATNKRTLARRIALDLTGLPPTFEEVETFINNSSPKAIETYVDHLMSKQSFGEHWASMWLDLARYADSAGYADDRKRTIWAYRDYVIRSFNANKSFDQFTREQIAGDLLTNPTEQQLVATAFHRNTQTNSEGGTIDEEFRNAAVVDRVNTTLAVWMGTTMGCAQCHTHKYDPITQEEYFQVFAILNNTADTDRTDEAPFIELWSDDQKEKKASLKSLIEKHQAILKKTTPAIQSSQLKWEERLSKDIPWSTLKQTKLDKGKKQTTLSYQLSESHLAGLKLAFPPSSKQAINIHQIEAKLIPKSQSDLKARYVRISIPGRNKILSLAEVQVFQNDKNIAIKGTSKQSSTYPGGEAQKAIDNNTDGVFSKKGVTHTKTQNNPWWELDLKTHQDITDLLIWNRTDNNLQSRLDGAVIELLDSDRKSVYKTTFKKAPLLQQSIFQGSLNLSYALQNLSNDVKDLSPLLKGKSSKPFSLKESKQDLFLALDKTSKLQGFSEIQIQVHHAPIPVNYFDDLKVEATQQKELIEKASLPIAILKTLNKDKNQRSSAESSKLSHHFRKHLAPELTSTRDVIAKSQKDLENLSPYTTVPVFKQLPPKKERVTKVQLRGNYLMLGKEVHPGVTKSIYPFAGQQKMTRLDLANWLMDSNNPLTARVTVNRYWEKYLEWGSSAPVMNSALKASSPLTLNF